MIHEIAPNGEFFINNVLSGTYELSIENENLCWEKPSIPLEISQNSNITDLKFHQLGFAMRYEVISTIEADVTLPKGKHEKWSFSPDQSYKCVQEQGDYLIKPDECASYKEETFKYRTYQAEKLSLIPERHLIAGELKFNLSKTSITKELLEKLPTALSQLNYLSIDSFNLDKTTLLENLKVPFVYKKDPQQKEILTFSYRHYVKPFTMNRIIPKTNKLINLDPTLHSLLENLLFYPQIREISISQTCQLHETNFLIKAGLILTGKIFPENITDVNVTIYQDNKAIQTILVRNGSFRAGPFSDHLNYQIEASKMNYRFLQIESHMVENILSFKMVAQRFISYQIIIFFDKNFLVSKASIIYL